MKNGTNIEEKDIKQKLEYLELDLNNIPDNLKEFESLNFRPSKSYDEKNFKQYRYLQIKDIQILLSPTNRLNELDEKYKKATPIYSYLVPENEEDILKHTKFLSMIKGLNINAIEQIEEEQKQLNKMIPFKVKYQGNYLWQIYYSESTDKYFMLVPTEDSNYSAFFYLLKKQLKKRKTGKIFVPISNAEYSNKYFKKSQFEDIENYLWLFTKDWPQIYEVYDKDDNFSIQIVGETEIYGKIKTPYKIKLGSQEDANKFYKLLKALFIMQTEIPHYYNFKINIDKYGSLEFLYNNVKMEYDDLSRFIRDQYIELIEKQGKSELEKNRLKEKLEKIKKESNDLEIEYLDKEKQISTFLECKKTFFGKVKYFFKYSKSKKNKNTEELKSYNSEIKNDENERQGNKDTKKEIKNFYTLEELIEEYKKFSDKENEITNLGMDINALKLKNKNLSKKIENATMYINEIDNHKRSIFEFWKYSNKDQVQALAEGEAEEVNIEKKISKVFDYEEDLENIGIAYDKKYRKELSEDELDIIYITTTNVLDILNKVKTNTIKPKDIDSSLKELKEEKQNDKSSVDEEIDIFGGILDDSRKLKTIANKKHREIQKDKFNILDINNDTKQLGYKLYLERIVENIKNILDKQTLNDDICIYKLSKKEELNIINSFGLFDINPESEIKNISNINSNKINLYKINLTKGTKAMLLTNIVYYNNKNRTLPEGMDLGTKVLVDLSKIEIKQKEKTSFKIVCFENDKDDLSKYDIKDINVIEYDIKQ